MLCLPPPGYGDKQRDSWETGSLPGLLIKKVKIV